LTFFSIITFIDILDIVVLAILTYQVLIIFSRTRASQLILGIFYFAVVFVIAFVLGMTATIWVFEKLAGLLAIALLIIFQPELRNFFERAGRRGFLLAPHNVPEVEDVENMLDTISQAMQELSEDHTGVLIVIEGEIPLNEYINIGERINAEVRKDLLKAIFYKGNPLHDGAVIIRDGRIASARSFLPSSDSRDIPSHLGTRHRAALGITEISDAVSLVVSEETGHLSLFHSGKPAFRLTPNTLRHMIKGIIIPETSRETPYYQFRTGLERYFKRGQKPSSKPVPEAPEVVASDDETPDEVAEIQPDGAASQPRNTADGGEQD